MVIQHPTRRRTITAFYHHLLISLNCSNGVPLQYVLANEHTSVVALLPGTAVLVYPIARRHYSCGHIFLVPPMLRATACFIPNTAVGTRLRCESDLPHESRYCRDLGTWPILLLVGFCARAKRCAERLVNLQSRPRVTYSITSHINCQLVAVGIRCEERRCGEFIQPPPRCARRLDQVYSLSEGTHRVFDAALPS